MAYINEINFRVYPELSRWTIEDTMNNPGAGIKFYGRLTGWLLSTFGFAKQVTVLGTDSEKLTLYVNSRSLAKFALRIITREVHQETGTQALQNWYTEARTWNPYYVDNIARVVNTTQELDLEKILTLAHRLAIVLQSP